MIKRISLLFFAATCLTCLSSCTVLGGLVQSILRLPTSILGAITEVEAESESPVEPVPGQPQEETPEAVSIALTPAK